MILVRLRTLEEIPECVWVVLTLRTVFFSSFLFRLRKFQNVLLLFCSHQTFFMGCLIDLSSTGTIKLWSGIIPILSDSLFFSPNSVSVKLSALPPHFRGCKTQLDTPSDVLVNKYICGTNLILGYHILAVIAWCTIFSELLFFIFYWFCVLSCFYQVGLIYLHHDEQYKSFLSNHNIPENQMSNISIEQSNGT